MQDPETELVHQKGEDPKTETVLQGTPVKEQLEKSMQDPATELVYREGGFPENSVAIPSKKTAPAIPAELVYQESGHMEQPLQSNSVPVKAHDIRTVLRTVRNRQTLPLHSAVSRDIRILNSQSVQTPEEHSIPLKRQMVRPAELAYLRQPAPETEPKEPSTAALPQWAQKLLEKPSGSEGYAEQNRYSASAGRMPPGGQTFSLDRTAGQTAGTQIRQWTAPDAAAPSISYRTPAGPDRQPQPAALSERELRRAADKIYRMIEERLRRELRRNGK